MIEGHDNGNLSGSTANLKEGKMENRADRLASRVSGFSVYASNNYTCSNEQHMLVQSFKPTQAGAAMALDYAAIKGVERRGCSGLGAGAVAEMLTDEDEEDDGGERIENMNEPVIRALPVGNLTELRNFIKHCRKDRVWDGHNLVICGAHYSQELLDQQRGR